MPKPIRRNGNSPFLNKVTCGDCLDLMPKLDAGSIDLILADLPYGTTSCSWDVIIPFEPLWVEFKRLLAPNCPVVLFGAEPFSTLLRQSNLPWFKYDWIWVKSRSLGFTNAKNKPLNKHEVISVFSKGTTANRSANRMPYYPQGLVKSGKVVSGIKACQADSKPGGHKFGRPGHKLQYVQEYTNYPTSVLSFSNEPRPQHPTQKPLDLMEYLVATYSSKGDLVLDIACGSGTTCVAAKRLGRDFIGFDNSLQYCRIAEERLQAA